MSVKRVNLIDIEPPGRQTELTWKAIKEGVREYFCVDRDNNPIIVVLPHRIQAKYVCRKCLKAIMIVIYTADAIKGNLALVRHCECGGTMHRRFLGAEMEVPVEIEGTKIDKKRRGTLDEYLEE